MEVRGSAGQLQRWGRTNASRIEIFNRLHAVSCIWYLEALSVKGRLTSCPLQDGKGLFGSFEWRAGFQFSPNTHISSSPSSPPRGGNHQTVSDLMRCVGARPILAQKHFQTTTPFIHGPFTGMVTMLLEDTWGLHERTPPTAVWMDVVEYRNYTPHHIYELL